MINKSAKYRTKISIPEILLAASLSAGLLFVLFYIRGFYPFGSGSIALTDLYSQYLPLLYRFYDVVTGEKNLFMDPAIGAGVNLYADTINEVLNPFNYFLLLFGRQRIWQGVNILLVCYLAAAAASADLSLQILFSDLCANPSADLPADVSADAGGVSSDASFNESSDAKNSAGLQHGRRKGLHRLYVILAVCYACSGYMAYNYQIIKWMLFPVIFPLFMVSFSRLLEEKKGGWYSILLAYQLVLNIQFGFMTLLFVFFGSAFYMRYLRMQENAAQGKNTAVTDRTDRGQALLQSETARSQALLQPETDRRTILLHLGTATLGGILLPGAVLAPSAMILLGSARSGELFSYMELMKQTGASDIADRVFQVAHPVLLALLVTSWVRRKHAHRKADPAEKILLRWNLFLWLTVLLQPANLLWHMGSYMCFPVRYAYMILFSMICLIAQRGRSEQTNGYERIRRNENTAVHLLQWATVLSLSAAALWASTHFAGRITQAFSSLVLTNCRKETLIVFGILGLFFAAALCAWKNRILQLITALCAGACMFLFIFLPQDYAVRQMNEQAYSRLMRQYEENRAETAGEGQEYGEFSEYNEYSEYGAFPVVLTPDDDTLPRDAAMVNGTRSLTCYMPTLSKKTQQTLGNLGYEVYWTATSSKGGSAASEELLTFAHLLGKDDEPGENNRVSFSVNSRSAAVSAEIETTVENTAENTDGKTTGSAVDNEIGSKTAAEAEEHTLLQLPFIAVNGWQCRVNGEKAELIETQDGLLGAALVPGRNYIEFRFLPPGLYAGIMLSIFGLCILLLQQRLRRRKESFKKAGTAAGILFSVLLAAGVIGIYILPFIGWSWNLAARLIPSVPSMEEVLDLSRLTVDHDAEQQGAVTLLKAVPVEDGMKVYAFDRNLMSQKGVKVTADSQESKQFPADYVHDGITEDNTLRWSSLNDRENSDHWLEVRLPKKQAVGMVRIYWERCNASRYALEFSDDGENWEAVCEFDAPTEDPVQDILLPYSPLTIERQAAEKEQNIQDAEGEENKYQETQYLRLHITEVLQNEEDLTLYYQNVSVLELEVYCAPSDVMEFDVPQIPAGTGRVLETPELRHAAENSRSGEENNTHSLTEGTTEELSGNNADGHGILTWIGADYPDLIDENGNIQDTIADVSVNLGYALSYEGMRLELPALETIIPASVDRTYVNMPSAQFAEWLPAGETERVPSEWAVSFTASGKNTDPEEGMLASEMAALFSKELTSLTGSSSQQQNSDAASEAASKTASPKPAQIELVLADPEKRYAFPVQNICGDEGFNIDLLTDGQTVRIFANTAQGLRWGCVTLKHILEGAQESGILESGWIRDYPRYKVRGFGIDTGRRAVSTDLLYDIIVALSDSRMNTLQIHLNDNEIISQSAGSGYDGSMESARKLYAGFRLESEIRNEDGIGITSEDFFYTKDAFRQLIRDARVYGVEIVPEIDMPAHSLAFTRVFPELGFSDNPEGADELDLGKAGASEFARKLWSEYLTENHTAEEAADEPGNPNGKGAVIIGDTAAAVGTDGPVFDQCKTVHIGMDEYFGRGEDYIAFLNKVAESVSEMAPDKEIRIWGSLTYIGADHSSVSRDLQMQIWDTQWTDPGQMYREGFRLINSISSSLYIIPGGGYDYLDMEFLKDSWQPNIFATKEKTWKMPSYSPQILGAVYMMWNDHAQADGEQITEEGLFDRFSQPLEILAEKLW